MRKNVSNLIIRIAILVGIIIAITAGALVYRGYRVTETPEGFFVTTKTTSPWFKDSDISEYAVAIYRDRQGTIRKIVHMEMSDVTDNFYQYDYCVVLDPAKRRPGYDYVPGDKEYADMLEQFRKAGGLLR